MEEILNTRNEIIHTAGHSNGDSHENCFWDLTIKSLPSPSLPLLSLCILSSLFSLIRTSASYIVTYICIRLRSYGYYPSNILLCSLTSSVSSGTLASCRRSNLLLGWETSRHWMDHPNFLSVEGLIDWNSKGKETR